MRYLNTVYVTSHQMRISRSKASLIVRNDDTRSRIPLEGIDGVVVVGGATMTLDAVAACVDRGIRVAVLKRSGAVRWTAGPPVQGNVALRRSQFRMSESEPTRLELARRFVAGKLQNSLRVGRRWARDCEGADRIRIAERCDLIAERIGRIESAASLDHLRGIEGDSARAYFAAMGIALAGSGFHFSLRTRRPPRDPVNALMGFGYGLIVTEVAGGLEAVGLDPQIGFLHSDRAGRPALALDLVEELRPTTDRFVVSALRRRQFGLDDFTVTPGGATYLSDQGRNTFFKLWESHKNATILHSVLNREIQRWMLPGIQATLLARHIRGDLPVYPPYLISW